MTTLAILALKAALPDEDEDGRSSSANKLALNFLINQGSRAYMDISFYANPMELENMSKNLVPLMSVMADGSKFMKSAGKMLGEDGDGAKVIYDLSNNIPLVRGLVKTAKSAQVMY